MTVRQRQLDLLKDNAQLRYEEDAKLARELLASVGVDVFRDVCRGISNLNGETALSFALNDGRDVDVYFFLLPFGPLCFDVRDPDHPCFQVASTPINDHARGLASSLETDLRIEFEHQLTVIRNRDATPEDAAETVADQLRELTKVNAVLRYDEFGRSVQDALRVVGISTQRDICRSVVPFEDKFELSFAHYSGVDLEMIVYEADGGELRLDDRNNASAIRAKVSACDIARSLMTDVRMAKGNYGKNSARQKFEREFPKSLEDILPNS